MKGRTTPHLAYPAIILSDADLELTVLECLTGSLSFNGQRQLSCLCWLPSPCSVNLGTVPEMR